MFKIQKLANSLTLRSIVNETIRFKSSSISPSSNPRVLITGEFAVISFSIKKQIMKNQNVCKLF
jgi:hypothetical protein